MKTYLVPCNHMPEIGIEWESGICVILTVLGRLNENVSRVRVGGMSTFFGWTEEEGVLALVNELNICREDALSLIIYLSMGGYIDEKNDTEIAQLFTSTT